MITIKEYEFLQTKYEIEKNFISELSFNSIEKFILDSDIQYLKITTKKGYGKVIVAQNYCGVIQTKDGTTIEILPKITNCTDENSKKILIKMLRTLKKSPFKNFNMANLKSSKMPLLEIFISMFLSELTKLIQKGIKSNYIQKEENLHFLKGKLNINNQIKHNYIHQERFYVQYDEFTSNTLENSLIKTTLEYLYKKSKSIKNQQKIREFLFVFDNIDISHNIKNDFSKIIINRQLKNYEQLLIWCKIFLLNNSFTPYKGDNLSFALLFNMNLLFESFVYSYFKKSNTFDSINAQDTSHHLAFLDGVDKKFQLKPDILINNGKIIADTKWKILSEVKTHQGVSQADMYQLYAYGTKYQNCDELYLIYPKDKLEIDAGNYYEYFKQDNKKLSLKVLFFDLVDMDNNINLIKNQELTND